MTDSYPTGACESPLASVASISSALRMNSFPFAVSLVNQKNKKLLKKGLTQRKKELRGRQICEVTCAMLLVMHKPQSFFAECTVFSP